uniref:Reverse transcriptase domain-containing protein n=1 Tax=Corethrella appendiculata TaxID=1370023 RepID=U5ER22_9DIPT
MDNVNDRTFLSYNIATINISNISNQNKINALRSFINLFEIDIVMLQEVYDTQLQIPGFEFFYNVDHSRRGTAIGVKSHIQVTNVERSLDSRIISMRINGNITLCNIYAPSGTQNRANRENFINNLIPFYLRETTDYKILGGDFNCVIDTKDSTGTSNKSIALKQLVQNLRLTDSWEYLNRNRVEFSFVRGDSSSRIDKIYVDRTHNNKIVSTNYQVNSFSDHKAFILRFQLPRLGRNYGRGIWRLKPQVMTEENITEFALKWAYWTRQRRQYTSWLEWWTAYVKPKIMSFFKWKTGQIYRRHTDMMNLLYFSLKRAYERYETTPGELAEINRIKGKMLNLQNNFSKLLFRSNENFISGEPISSFQICNRIKNKSTTTIKNVIIQGQVSNNPDEIIQATTNFFKDLYTSTDVQNIDIQPEKVIAAGNEDNENLMDEITTDEIYSAIKGSAPKKSPGLDGLPREFYLRVWDIIKTEFSLIINEVKNGNISRNLMQGIIVLVKKKNTCNELSSYRPISLLNVDYKILSRVLKYRLDKIMPEILSSHQKCSNGTKNIFEATCGIRDKIAEIRHRKKKAILAAFDLNHAFDRVEKNFLLHVMQRMNINQSFVNFVNNTMSNSSSKLLVNGNLSESFAIERSVRQGDPLSMHLFVIYLQPLLDKLARICDGEHDLLSGYADDISVIIDSIIKLNQIRTAFEEFCAGSGALVNYNKTYCITIGATQQATPDWIVRKDSVKILGVVYENSIAKMTTTNWKTAVDKYRIAMWVNRPRSLNIIQKVILINTYAASKLWYLASILPPPNGHAAKIVSLTGMYFWTGTTIKVPMQQLILPKAEGGLGLHSVIYKSKALFLNRALKTKQHLSYTNSYIQTNSNPPNLTSLPSGTPYIKILIQELAYIPSQLVQTPNCHKIYLHLLQHLPKPKVMINSPNEDWPRIWKNIHHKSLTSQHKSKIYMIVNEKLYCRHVLFRQQQVPNDHCEFCPNEVDTIAHKYSQCTESTPLWEVASEHLLRQVNQPLIFQQLLVPALQRFNTTEKNAILKTLATYVNFIDKAPPQNRSVHFLQFELDLIDI